MISYAVSIIASYLAIAINFVTLMEGQLDISSFLSGGVTVCIFAMAAEMRKRYKRNKERGWKP